MSPTVVPSTATTADGVPDAAPSAISHPLDPLTPDEIAAASLAVRHHFAQLEAETKVALKFITCYLLPPPKKAVLAYLGIPLGPEPESQASVNGSHLPPRKAEVDVINVINGHAYNIILVLQDAKWVVESLKLLPEGVQPQISVEELIAAEVVVRNDERVQKLAAQVGVTPEQIFCDGWSIGYDTRYPANQRLQQALVFARYSQHDNLYAHPLDFIVVLDSNTEKVVHIDFPPIYKRTDKGKIECSVESTTIPPVTASEEENLSNSARERIKPSTKSWDFLPDLMQKADPNLKFRDDVKPLHVVQPKGASFKMKGHELEWQKWKMHIAFSHREGIVLSTITYNDDGNVRPLFYRLSLAEMVVPYGAPEWPHSRKFAFDTGEYGMGTMANELTLGCDCLGTIHYLPGAFVGNDGKAIIIKNVICIHEEDAGVLWKHTDYRPEGRAQTVRSRRLVVSMVCTLANYEYIWNYHFYQDGSVELEIRLTGILQVYAAADNEPNVYGTTIAPNINAQYHSHIFSIRVDPMIDGLHNSVIETDVVPLEAPTGSDSNFAGNGFTINQTVLKNAAEGGRPYSFETDRRWSIINPSKKHYSAGTPVGYTIRMNATPMIAKADSWSSMRAGFVKNALWVCPDVEDETYGSRMWPSGKYVPQTRAAPEDSITKWTSEDKNIDNEDILVYVTCGTIHIPRAEDWPVMPVEHLRVSLKPTNFFTANPSMDVPGIKDTHSVPAFPNGDSAAACCQ